MRKVYAIANELFLLIAGAIAVYSATTLTDYGVGILLLQCAIFNARPMREEKP